MDLIEKLKDIKKNYDEINAQLADPANMSDQSKLIELSKKRSELEEIVNAFNEYEKTVESIEEYEEIIDSGEDAELVEIAEAEIDGLKEKRDKLEDEIKLLLIPKDPNDDKDAIMEIRQGTGGEEAALFAADLMRMYTRFIELKGWKYEIIELNESSGLGGIKEVVMNIHGKNVYGDLKFESGVHRVQRVPLT
ncbi:MAG: PCRF domain-containing protein, partial [Ignavibacteria bacterium]